MSLGRLMVATIFVSCGARMAFAADADEVAKKLSNPVAAMISVPFQFNADFGAGPDGGGSLYNLKIQPVIPISLSPSWNVISRTILPIVGNDGMPAGNTIGLGDTSQSFFFSPAQPGPGGLIWGVGPVFSIPTATDDAFGSGKWGVGPTGLVLKQTGKATVGMLASHTWSVAGDDDRPDVSTTFLQPFFAYALGGGQTLTLNSEASYNWTGGQWTVPLNLTYSKVFNIGHQAMSWVVGGRYYAVKPDGGPDWGIRTGLTLVFPQR